MSRTPTFIWRKYSEVGEHYYTWILFPEECWTAIAKQTLYDTFLSYPDALDEETRYRWYVTAISGDLEKSGVTRYFTTGTGFNNPPLVPYNPDPEDGASGTFLYAALSWGCYDPDGDDLTYDVWLDTFLGDEVLIADDIFEKTADPGELEPEKTFSWRVVAFDAQGDSTLRSAPMPISSRSY